MTIALEFCRESGNLAALGTDTLFTLDGRWGTYRRREAIYDRVAELRESYPGKYGNIHFVGYNVMGTHNYTPNHLDARMSDRTPPTWVTAPEYRYGN